MAVSDDKSFIIALDGPAASGKGTLARKLAKHYRFAYLDTGVLYRGVAWVMLHKGLAPSDEAAAAQTAREFSLHQIEGASIRTAEVGAASSVVAANGAVRAGLLDFQRRFAEDPPPAGSQPPEARAKKRARGGAASLGVRGAVLDGRDIGTVVCPGATVKFFVTASPEVRAQRRYEELKSAGSDKSFDQVAAELAERDARDAARDDAPMVQAPDAELLDSTHLTIEQAFAVARRVIDGVLERWNG